jgi:hypothetical protein
MATQTQREYTLQGIVVDRASQRGVAGLRVTAWDRDTVYHDMLGQAVTAADGSFAIAFDSSYFGNAKPDNGPDVFYRVERDGVEVLDTLAAAGHNLQRGTTQVKLEIDLPVVAPTGIDRIPAEQALKAVDWWQASDFRGTWSQGKDKGSTVGKLLGSLLGSAFTDFDFDPVRPGTTQEKEIVGQPAANARSALAKNQVQVSDVKPASTLGTAQNLKLLTGYPVNLKANDKVTLYEDKGVVKYYTVDAVPVASADAQTVARLDGEVQSVKARVASLDDMRVEIENVRTANAEVAARADDEAVRARAHAQQIADLKAQLTQVQQANANKDVQIAKLQNDLATVGKAQDNLSARLPLDRLALLEKQMSALSAGTSPRVGAVRAAAAGTGAAKAPAAKAPATARRKPKAKPD